MDTCSLSPCKAPSKDLMDLLHLMEDLMKDSLHSEPCLFHGCSNRGTIKGLNGAKLDLVPFLF